MAKKMRTCGTCGNEIAKSAKVCPHCGAKQKGGKLKTILIALVVFIVIVAVAGGGKSKPKKVESDDTSKVEQTETSTDNKAAEEKKDEAPKQDEQTTFTIGDTADFDGVQIQVQNAILSDGQDFVTPDEGKKFLGVIISVVNNSDKDINISSIANFEAYCDDYALQQDLLGYQCEEWDGYSQVDNKVAAGKRLGGVICYQVPADFGKFDISISPDFWSNKKVDFTFTHDQCN